MSMSNAPPRLAGWRGAGAGVHLVVSLTAGTIAGAAIAAPLLDVTTAALIAWIVAAVVFLGWTWAASWPLDAWEAEWLAAREDGSRTLRDLTLLVISLGTLVTVVVVIFRAHHGPVQRTVLGVVAIVASWLVLHTIFTTRYARLYYSPPTGGIDYNGDDAPTYRDFAYLSFTIGMTFQVSDTALGKTAIRMTALWHALTSFVFNTVIIAVTVNIVAGLGG
jgi:uncharacterized membrane protein